MIEKSDSSHCFGAQLICLAATPYAGAKSRPRKALLETTPHSSIIYGTCLRAVAHTPYDPGFFLELLDPTCMYQLPMIEGFFFLGDPLSRSPRKAFLVNYDDAGGSWAAYKTPYPLIVTHCVYVTTIHNEKGRKIPSGVAVLVKGREEKT